MISLVPVDCEQYLSLIELWLEILVRNLHKIIYLAEISWKKIDSH